MTDLRSIVVEFITLAVVRSRGVGTILRADARLFYALVNVSASFAVFQKSGNGKSMRFRY